MTEQSESVDSAFDNSMMFTKLNLILIKNMELFYNGVIKQWSLDVLGISGFVNKIVIDYFCIVIKFYWS